jgi:hypothetical protein
MGSARWRDVIEVAFASLDRAAPKKAMKGGFFIDLSQCVSRKKWGTKIHTLTQSTVLYEVGKDRLCTGSQHLSLQGMPSELSRANLTDSELRKLAGEGMFLPSVASVLLAVTLNPMAPWFHQAASPPFKRQRA